MSDLERDLQNLYEIQRVQMQLAYNRSLPWFELPFDRWERAKWENFGEDTSIYQSSYVFGEVGVGDRTWIGPFTVLDGSGGLTIGSNCSISAGVQIYTHSAVNWALTNGEAPYTYKPVKIGDCVFVGPQTVIAMGVKIGDHVIIGAGSFVDRDLPSYTLCVGQPCKPRKRLVISGSKIFYHPISSGE